MSKIHYFQRYSSVENTVTNNTLQLIARIYNYSPNKAAEFINNLIDQDEPIDIGLTINQQMQSSHSVPDGSISQKSFKILIESKVDSSVDINQLINHAKGFDKEEKKFLILLTKSIVDTNVLIQIQNELSQLNTGIIFSNVTYEAICQAASNLFKEYEYEMSELVEDYKEYCNDSQLFDQSKNLMRIVPCGISINLNKKYGLYFQPSDRGYTNHQFIGIYKDKRVQTIIEIESVFDVEIADGILQKTLVWGDTTHKYDEKIQAISKDALIECGYDLSSSTRFFCGNQCTTNFEKISPYGIQGARFVNLKDILGSFSDLSDIANKLRNKTWT